MQTRTIGETTVSAVGLGAMPLSIGHDGVGDDRARLTIHAALDAGIRLVDTADAYHPNGSAGPDAIGHNELLVAAALASWSGDTDDVLVATKGGHTRTAGGGWGVDGRPEYLRRACEASLDRLGVEAIGLYQHHRPDPDVPYSETLGALGDLQAEGKIRMIGISNADPGQIRQAAASVDLVSVQNQFSPAFRSSRTELDLCAEMGIAFLPWSPLGGTGSADELGERHGAFAAVAAELEASPQQVALAWELAQAPVVIPIPGSSRPETALSSAQAADLELSGDQLQRLNAA